MHCHRPVHQAGDIYINRQAVLYPGRVCLVAPHTPCGYSKFPRSGSRWHLGLRLALENGTSHGGEMQPANMQFIQRKLVCASLACPAFLEVRLFRETRSSPWLRELLRLASGVSATWLPLPPSSVFCASLYSSPRELAAHCVPSWSASETSGTSSM